MNETEIQRIADLLWKAQQDGTPCPAVRGLIEEASRGEELVTAAYAVQSINTARHRDAGHRLVGRKIGLTSVAVQKQLGIASPDFGMLFDHMAVGDGEEISMSRTLQPKVEAEVALIIGRDLVHERHTFADIIRATEYVLPAIEVVGSRISNWDIRLADTVADNASSGLFVLGSGPRLLREVDLVACAMTMRRGEDVVSSGSGAACLGNPLNAAVWLADMMVKVGAPLKAGDVVMTGALGPMVPVIAGDRFSVEIGGIGRVDAAFSK